MSTIMRQTHKCKSLISVAFITESGLASLKSYLYDLNEKGIKGKIITQTIGSTHPICIKSIKT